MDAIDVLDGGLLTTVQDLGRIGFQRYGVPVSGAMDGFALRAANALVGNPDGAAGLEITLLGPRLRFAAATTIALAGADLDALIDNEPASRGRAIRVERGAVLSFRGPKDGVRAYLAIAGGLDVPLVLDSRSTYLRSRLGGLEGRALRTGDVLGALSVTAPSGAPLSGATPDFQLPLPVYGHDHVVRVILGPQDDGFTEAGVRTFLSSTYTVSAQSDRMGYRLSGPRIEHRAAADIVSDGTPLGAVQVAGDGTPIVLMADRGTAGGYTKIAAVISVDVARVAQAAPGDTVRFAQVTLAGAHAALQEQATRLQEIRQHASQNRAEAVPAARAQDHERLRRKAAAAAAAVARLLQERS